MKRLKCLTMSLSVALCLVYGSIISSSAESFLITVGSVIASPGDKNVRIPVSIEPGAAILDAVLEFEIASDLTLKRFDGTGGMLVDGQSSARTKVALLYNNDFNVGYNGTLLVTLVLDVSDSSQPGLNRIALSSNSSFSNVQKKAVIFSSSNGGIEIKTENIETTADTNAVDNVKPPAVTDPSLTVVNPPVDTQDSGSSLPVIKPPAETLATESSLSDAEQQETGNPLDSGSNINVTDSLSDTSVSKEDKRPTRQESFSSPSVIVKNAINKAIKTQNSTVILNNIKIFTKQDADAVIKAAESNVKLSSTVVANTVKDKKVIVRLTIDALKTTGNIGLSASSVDATAQNISKKITKTYSNKVKVINFNQIGKFNQNVNVTLTIDKSIMAKNIKIYSFDLKTNRLKKLKITGGRLSKTGVLSFNLAVGGQIVISDGALKKKV
ncbi:MAG: hypothetical protein LBR74_00885, partial [Eubacterium sp.]|nr:hypothetical protein [Eubacterium sp.]